MSGELEEVKGLLLVDKPTGPTSHDVIKALRCLLENKKVGHTGTLDPLASGLLVALVGTATKLAPFIPGDPKIYEGSMILGKTTDTLDIEGKVLSESNYKRGPEIVISAMESLVGEIEQSPPMFSAVKYQGKPLYHYARKGEDVPRRRRKVHLYNVEMVGFNDALIKPQCDFRLSCSTGFYVRVFISRIGEILGCGATLSRLRRISSGPFRVEQALSLEELSRRFNSGEKQFLSIAQALERFKGVVVGESVEKAARNGAALEGNMIMSMEEGIETGETIIVLTTGNEVIGLHEVLAVNPLETKPQRIL
jgi:tRNA pseudouridine55 synthase